VAQIPSGETIEVPDKHAVRAFRAGAPANHIFAPHPNERSQAFLGPPLLTPRQAQMRLPGPRYWRQRPIIAYRYVFGKREVVPVASYFD
jgi:hypothetical protein